MNGGSKVGHSSQPQYRGSYLVHLQDSTNRACQKGALPPFRHVRAPAVLWASTFALQCCGRPQLPYQANMVKHPTFLWASTVLWAPAFTIPGEHGKTSYKPLGINSMVGAGICHTRRRRRNLPHASDINSVVGAYNHDYTRWRGQQDLIAYINSHSPTCKAIPFIYKRGCALSQ